MSLIGSVTHASAVAGAAGLEAQNNVGVPVTVSSRQPTPEELADALLRSLNFTPEDLKAYQEQYGINLRDFFIKDLTEDARAGRLKYGELRPAAGGKYQGYIGLPVASHRQLKEFIAARRGTATQPQTGGGEQTARGRQLRVDADARRRQIERQAGSTAVLGGAAVAAPELPRVVPALPRVVGALPEAAPLAAEALPLAVAAVEVAGVGVTLKTLLEIEIQRQVEQRQREFEQRQRMAPGPDVQTSPPPFSQNQPVPPPPPLVSPDQSERGRRLNQPITTPAAPQAGTSTPPFSTGQPLPPPPPLITPSQADRFAALTKVLMSTSREQALKDLLTEAAAGGIVIHTDAEAQRLLDWAAAQQGVPPENFQAVTLGGDIFVRPEYAENVRVLREELIHVTQQAAGIGTDQIVQAEIEARLQIIMNRRQWAITNEEVREMIDEIRQMRKTGRY